MRSSSEESGDLGLNRIWVVVVGYRWMVVLIFIAR